MSAMEELSAWPDPSQEQIKLKYAEVINDDKKLIKKINDLNSFAVGMEDFLSLNGDVSVYGWQHVMNFALYEKYNFLLPLLKQNLDDEALFKELVGEETHGLKDFVYVYCTMLTLILRRLKPENRLYSVLSNLLNDLKLEDALGGAVEEFQNNNKGVIIVPKGQPTPAKPTPTAKSPAKPPATAKPTPAAKPKPAAKPTPAAKPKKDYSTGSSITDGMRLNIQGKKYIVKKAITDGNCLFDAVRIALELILPPSDNIYYRRSILNDTALKLRNNLADFVEEEENNINYVNANVSGKKNIPNKEAHKDHLQSTDYGQDEDVVLLREYFNICIFVFRWKNGEKKWEEISTDTSQNEKENCKGRQKIYLVHSGANERGAKQGVVHYDALIPEQAGSPTTS